MISYQANGPKWWCGDPRRGAALGRPTITGDAGYGGRLYLRRIRLNSGGYDRNGTYFGHGRPLFWCASADGAIDRMTRADDREDAKRLMLEEYPNARFFR